MSNPNALNIHIDRGDGYFISTDRSKLNIERICEWISTDCYWAIGRPHEVIRTSIENSLAFGVYTLTEGGTEEQIAFARVVTDYSTFAWIDDVYVSRPHRKRGLSHFIIDVITDLLRDKLGIHWIVLATFDAQSLYQKHGYQIFTEQNRKTWMLLPESKSDPAALPPNN